MKLKIYILSVFSLVNYISADAQDYLISFTGTGASTSVADVKVENLTQAKSLTINGSDILHLKNVITGIESYTEDSYHRISFSPNPMTDYTLIRFDLPENGQTTISLFDITGKTIFQIRDHLNKGRHEYRMQGIDNGIYIVKIVSDGFSSSGRLISSGYKKGNPKITYESVETSLDKKIYSKGTDEEVVMQYNTGDILKLTGISGNFATVVTDVPAASKTINFNFVPCTDGDGNNYPVVQIGTQIWMGENLKTTKFSDGTVIPNVTDDLEWSALKSPGYCWYNNNSAIKNTYGGLYNWYTVTTGKLCPEGWSVPIDDEWTTLINSLGGKDVAGGKLKENGNAHWESPNDATNESGFTALPGGYRNFDGAFNGLTGNGNWRSSTPYVGAFSWYQYLLFYTGSIYTYYGNHEGGFSIRCLKD